MAYAFPCAGNSKNLLGCSAAKLIERWDPVIRRLALNHARRFNRESDAADFAQEARIKLFLKAGTHGEAPDAYIRKIIWNAILAACLRSASVDGCEPLSEETEQISGDIPENDHLQRDVVGAWLCGLDAKLWAVCDLIYFKGLTQVEAAEILDVSQPRIAQLHRQLILDGRLHFAGIPAVR